MSLRTSALTVGVVASAAAAVVAASMPAVADVHRSDLPTARQVAHIYPALEGGSRDVFRGRTVDTPTKDCLAYRSPIRAESGRWAGYRDADGDSIYFQGFADPTVFVYEFASRSKARDAFRILRKHYSQCEGTFEDADVSFRRDEIGVPAFGKARYAFRTRQEDFGISSVDHFVDIYVLHGRRLVNTRAQADGFQPAKRQVVRLTGLALDRAT